jgi:hypothetical protein
MPSNWSNIPGKGTNDTKGPHISAWESSSKHRSLLQKLTLSALLGESYPSVLSIVSLDHPILLMYAKKRAFVEC